jgi:Uncharacterized conserved protein
MMLGLDGADPFIVRELMEMGRLPNLKKLLEQGTANKSLAMLGVFPSVTPPNWASLATGNYPRTHGVTCYYNHTLGKTLGINEINWDSRRVKSELIWETFGKQGKRCLMLNYCEAWPPRLRYDDKNVYVDGTGVLPFMRSNIDYQKIVVLEKGDFPMEDIPHAIKESSNDCVVQGDQFEQMSKEDESGKEDYGFGPLVETDVKVLPPDDLGVPPDDEADYVHSPLKEPENWERELPLGALAATVPLADSTIRRYFVLTASDGVHYDTITIYQNRRADGEVLGQVKAGKWSQWIYDLYNKDGELVKTAYMVRWLSSEDDGSKVKLYVSYAQNLEDTKYTYPEPMGRKLLNEVGPALCFAKYGQVRKPDWDDHQALLETFEMNINWHIRASNWLFEQYPDWQLYYIHLHGIDLYNHWYISRTIPGSDPDWEKYREILYRMYELHDVYIGEMMKQLDAETAIFVCSDHAGIPHSIGDVNPGIGCIAGITVGVMEELGYTKTYIDEKDKLQIDWSQTKAVFHRTSHIYINLKGRDPDGIVEPEDYDATVQQLIGDLYNYRHKDTGKRVVAFCMTRDEMEIVGMGGPHCGDILCQLVPTYCEEHANCPTTATNEGHSLNNLLIMAGAGIKKGELINRVVRVTDVVPTICHLTETDVPSNVEGGVIWQALEGFAEESF